MCKKVLWALACIAVIICIAFSVLKHLFPRSYHDIMDEYCNKYNVDINLASAVAKAESNFNENSVSSAGAKGIMQLTDSTFDFCRENAVISDSDIFDPDTNIHAGVWYLSYLATKYNGNTENILAAYNAGMGNVDRWLEDKRYSSDGKTLSDIPFPETERYVEKVNRYKAIYSIFY